MPVVYPVAWVKNVERLYREQDAQAVSKLYAADCRVRVGATLLTPDEVHRHPYEWFGSLEDYRIRRTFRAAYGDIIVSETTATRPAGATASSASTSTGSTTRAGSTTST